MDFFFYSLARFTRWPNAFGDRCAELVKKIRCDRWFYEYDNMYDRRNALACIILCIPNEIRWMIGIV